MEFERLRQMLDGLGPNTPRILEVARAGDTSWIIEMDDGTGLVVEWMEHPARMVFSAPCGRPPVDRRFVVYESLLSFNSLWHETGGTRLALNGAEGEVMVVQELSADDVTPALLDDAVTGFADLAVQWRDYVCAEAQTIDLPLPRPMLVGLFA